MAVLAACLILTCVPGARLRMSATYPQPPTTPGRSSASAATSAVIVSVDAHCPTSSTASALSAVSVTLFGEVTNRLSNPLGSVHHGKMARLIAGNGKNRQVAMASDAGLRGEMSTPGQISRRGCLFVLLALVITAAILTCAALFVLHRIFPAPPTVWSEDGEQFAQLRSLQGTWQDSVGGKIIFTDTSFAPGGILTGGQVTFVNVPQVFSWAWGHRRQATGTAPGRSAPAPAT